VAAVAFDAGGDSILTGGEDGVVRRWEVARPASGPPDRLVLRAQALTGAELDTAGDPDGVVRLLDAETWHRRCRELDHPDGPPAR
jgi:hypothetical protein